MTPLTQLTSRLSARPIAIPNVLGTGFLVLAGLLIAAIVAFPGAFTAHNPEAGDVLEKFTAPNIAHPFGTDHLGRDVLARVFHGMSATLTAGVVATAIAFLGGVLLGLVAGYAGRLVAGAVMRVVDVVLTVPSILIVLIVVTSLGRSTLLVAVSVGIAGLPRFTRLTRAETLRARSLDFVAAGQMSGSSPGRITRIHILPTVLPVVSSIVAVEFAHALLTIASLTFLGMGTPGPAPELGLIVSEGRNYLGIAWWISILPGLTIVAIVLLFYAFGKRVFGTSVRSA